LPLKGEFRSAQEAHRVRSAGGKKERQKSPRLMESDFASGDDGSHVLLKICPAICKFAVPGEGGGISYREKLAHLLQLSGSAMHA
jgi:hypothetical protein